MFPNFDNLKHRQLKEWHAKAKAGTFQEKPVSILTRSELIAALGSLMHEREKLAEQNKILTQKRREDMEIYAIPKQAGLPPQAPGAWDVAEDVENEMLPETERDLIDDNPAHPVMAVVMDFGAPHAVLQWNCAPNHKGENSTFCRR